MAGTTALDPTLTRRLERLSLVTRRRLARQAQGDRRSRFKGASMEFADYRPYTPGDDPNRIDWRIYARTDSLFVRAYEDEALLDVHFVIDASRSMDWGTPNKLRFTCRVAAALGYVALRSSTRLSIWPLAARAARPSFGPAWGRRHIRDLVTYLDGVESEQRSTPALELVADNPPPDLHAAVAARLPARASGLFLFISDLLSPTWEEALRRFGSHQGEVVVLHVLAPDELRPSLGGDLRLIDRESGAEVAVTLNTDALRRYADRLKSWRREVENACARQNVVYVPVESAMPLDDLIFTVLRKRGVLR